MTAERFSLAAVFTAAFSFAAFTALRPKTALAVPVLQKYLPSGSEHYAADLMSHHKIQLRIKNPRLTKLGDYRPPTNESSHRISINRDLNPFSFLITFMHEVAHLVNFEKSGPRVPPHGIEWKREFQVVSTPIIQQNLLPNDVHSALNRYLKNPKASSCTDDC